MALWLGAALRPDYRLNQQRCLFPISYDLFPV